MSFGSYTDGTDKTIGHNNVLDPNNSTTTPLGAGGVFTGTATEILPYCNVSIMISSDVSSASNSMCFQFSIDGINWDDSLDFTLDAAVSNTRRFVLAVQAQYFRVKYTNGATPQGYFRMQTILHKGNAGLPTVTVSDNLSADRSATVVRAVATGQAPNGIFEGIRKDGYHPSFTSNTPLLDTQVFDSELVNMEGYEFLINDIFADQPGTILGLWYSDPGETQLIRTFQVPYDPSQNLVTFGTVIYGPYLRYTFTNNSGSDQTKFHLRMRLTNTPYNGQLLGLESFVPPNILTAANRAIIVGKNPSGVYRNVNLDKDDNLNVEAPSQFFGDKALSADRTTFGSLAVTEQSSDLEINFSTGFPADTLETTVTGTGAAFGVNSKGRIETGTGATSSASFESRDQLRYRVGQEHYLIMTARWENAGTDAGDEAIIGMLSENANDGYAIGYIGTQWGIIRRQNGTQTFVPQASFSKDKLDGSASSLYTENGVPVAIDKTKLNLFRIVWGWQGSAVINYRIQSPDGNWLTFHTETIPNKLESPSSFVSDLELVATVSKTAGSHNLALESAAISTGHMGKKDGKISSGNTTTVNLGANATFTGKALSLLDYAQVNVFVSSDQDSADGGLQFQYSSDGTTWRTVNSFTFKVADGEVRRFQLGAWARFFRLVYTNGPVATTDLDIQTILLPQQTITSIGRVGDNISADRSLTLTKSVLAGADKEGVYRNVGVNEVGALNTTSFLLDVARERYDNYRIERIDGRNSVIDSNSTPEDVWNGGGLYTGFNATTNENLQAFSSSAADAGTLVTSGTATGGSETTLVDSGANFTGAGVVAGNIVINDTQGIHGIITNVTATTLTVYRWEGTDIGPYSTVNGNTYRIASAASTGAAVVRWEKILNASYVDQGSAYIILNGTTPVTYVINAMRCSRGRVVLAGTSGTNAGTITLRQATTTANIFAAMPADAGETAIACDTVPAGKTRIVSNLLIAMSRSGGTAGSANTQFQVRRPGEAWQTKRFPSITNAQPYNPLVEPNLIIPERSDIRWRVQAVSDNGTSVSAEFEYIEIDNSVI